MTGLETLTADGVGLVMDLLDDMGVSRLIITDSDGLVLYDTLKEDNAKGRYAIFPEIVQALKGYDVFSSTYQAAAFQSKAALPVMYRNNAIGAVYVFESDTEQAGIVADAQNYIQNLSIVVSAIILVLCWFFSKALTRRISEILRSIRIVREGEYSHRVAIRGNDELGELAEEFNKLTDRLQTTEEMRRRFVSDASHELKTPLASIRLLTDSILQTENIDTQMTHEFVQDIGNEADRLARMTEKLLDLSRLDDRMDDMRCNVDVKLVVSNVVHMLHPLADVRKVKIKCIMDEGCMVYATDDDLYQIIFNLIENGIKYNMEGGMVQALLFCKSNHVILIVEDTGIGIPDEDLPRIFERFYRVDKARSREAGGSGIGLSIVKETVNLHGGTIEVSSRVGGGTRFTVTFPLAQGGDDL